MEPWQRWVLRGVVWAFSGASAVHVLLFKRDPRAALGWIVACLAFPPWGALAYWALGVNRIRRQAQKLRRSWLPAVPLRERVLLDSEPEPIPDQVSGHLREIARISNAVTRRPLVEGNRLVAYHDGAETFEDMLAAIDGAERSVHLSSYIFYVDGVGRRFVASLAGAVRRGVAVRVLVDGIGELYGRPRVTRVLRRNGVPAVRFLPPTLRRPVLHANLRNHRKILVVDGRVGWTGGMNLGDHQLARQPVVKRPVVDLHFRVEGPVVAQMDQAFVEDWEWVTGDEVRLEAPPAPCGDEICRGVGTGPDEAFEKLHWMLLGAISAARESVLVMTPYFLPGRELVAGLVAAALRGVRVEVVLPARNNVPPVHWASRAVLPELVEAGVVVHEQPGPFVHSKLIVVDRCWTLVGSSNLDARSLRLNFEFNLEVFGSAFGADLVRHFEEVRERSRPLTLEALEARRLPVRVRDGLAWLLSPYL